MFQLFVNVIHENNEWYAHKHIHTDDNPNGLCWTQFSKNEKETITKILMKIERIRSEEQIDHHFTRESESIKTVELFAWTLNIMCKVLH